MEHLGVVYQQLDKRKATRTGESFNDSGTMLSISVILESETAEQFAIDIQNSTRGEAVLEPIVESVPI
jgi:hypothetical protein